MTDFSVVPIPPFSGKAKVMIHFQEATLPDDKAEEVYAFAAVVGTVVPLYVVERRDKSGISSLGYASHILQDEEK